MNDDIFSSANKQTRLLYDIHDLTLRPVPRFKRAKERERERLCGPTVPSQIDSLGIDIDRTPMLNPEVAIAIWNDMVKIVKHPIIRNPDEFAEPFVNFFFLER